MPMFLSDMVDLQSYRWGEILGKISVAWDPSGKIVSYEGEPLRLTNTTQQDSTLQGEVNSWREPFDVMAREVVGSSGVDLDQSTCQFQECELASHGFPCFLYLSFYKLPI